MKNTWRKCAILTTILAFFGGAASAQNGNAPIVATINAAQPWQRFDGWGTSLAWWAHVVGGYPADTRQKLVDMFFNQKTGLGLNVIRYNIGGGENPVYMPPNHEFLTYRSAVPGYEPSPGVWNWNADQGQRTILAMAMKEGANRLQAFSNSPPWWMTISGSVTGGHGGGDNLAPDKIETFTAYMAAVLKHFQDTWHITFNSVEPLNEPLVGWAFGNGQEGCHVDSAEQNLVITSMGKSLRSAGIVGTTVAASDETSITFALQTFPFYDPTSLGYMSQVDTHSYWGSGRAKLAGLAAGAHKALWLSEYGDGDASGIPMSQRILQDVRNLRPSAWVYWQTMDSAGGWGFVWSALDSRTDTTYRVNQKYYVMANYSRFIRPGSQIIADDDTNSLAAIDPMHRHIVIVATNATTQPQPVTYTLVGAINLGSTASVWQTCTGEQLQIRPAIPAPNGKITTTLPPKSVTTFVVNAQTRPALPIWH